jgi:microcystin-dependent protein
MGQPYVGEIRMFAGSFAPAGWAFCSGQLIPISENDTLFTLIGTTYGGDGQETFALPDLQSRVPMHQGSVNQIASKAGVETVTLSAQQIPIHTHAFLASTVTGTQIAPAGEVLASLQAVKVYRSGPGVAAMAPGSVTSQGGSQPHNNLQPLLVVNFIISLFGVFPTQS